MGGEICVFLFVSFLFLLPLAKAVEQCKKGYPHQCIDQGANQIVQPVPLLMNAYQPAQNQDMQGAGQQDETEIHDEAGARIVDVNAQANGGREIAKDAIDNAVDAERQVRHGVLNDADDHAQERAAHGVTSRNGKINDDQRGQVENVEGRKAQRNVSLQKNGNQRNENQDDRMETVLFHFSTRALGQEGHSQFCGSSPVVGWVGAAGWCAAFGCSVVVAGTAESPCVALLVCTVAGFDFEDLGLDWDAAGFGCDIAGAVSPGLEPDEFRVVVCPVVADGACAG